MNSSFVLNFLTFDFRARYVGFLPQIQSFYAGLYMVTNPEQEIPSNEEFDFYTFCNQFTTRLWTVITSLIISIALIKSLTQRSFQKGKFIDMVIFIWTSFTANLGGKPNANPSLDLRKSYRIVVFTSLMCGTAVWIFYRAQMNAVLSIRSKSLPFTDLESIAETDWR